MRTEISEDPTHDPTKTTPFQPLPHPEDDGVGPIVPRDDAPHTPPEPPSLER